jgi:hypothetical protein
MDQELLTISEYNRMAEVFKFVSKIRSRSNVQDKE